MSVSHNKAKISAENNNEESVDTLRKCLLDIEVLCEHKGVALFNGNLENVEGNAITWVSEDPKDWKKFLDALFASGTKVLVYSVIDYPMEEEINEFIKNVISTLDEGDRENFWHAHKQMQSRYGYVASLDLYFSYQGIGYKYSLDAEWFQDYELLSDMITTLPGDTHTGENQWQGDEGDVLSNEEVETWARKILTDEQYLQAKSRRERVGIASTLLEADGIDGMFTNPTIVGRAEEIYQKEIVPVQEEKLKQKVIALKQKGTNKTEAKGILGISITKLEKYWYL